MELVENKFKQTEVGLIPEGWSVLKIQDLIDNASIISHLDGNHGELYPRSHEFKPSGVPYVGANDFYNGQVSFSNCKYLSEERAKQFKKGIAKHGDVLFAHNATVGPVAFLKTEFEYIILSTTATFFRCDNKKLNNHFLLYALQAPSFVKQYTAVMTQSTRFQVPITAQRKFLLVLPTIEEQTAIATALSDADNYISSLENLITKKRLIKQGAMQQLLTPKEGWVVKKLGEIGEITGAGVDKKIRSDETPVRLVNFLDVFNHDFIYSNQLNHWVTARPLQVERCSVRKGDVFFTPSSEMRFDIAISAVAMEDIPNAAYSYHLVRLRLFDDWDLKFRTYIFKQKSFLDQAETICEGSGKRYVISLTKFREMEISYPESMEEQTRFATILSDMDVGIAALEKKLAKARSIKQGMMQQLLTGKIRLV